MVYLPESKVHSAGLILADKPKAVSSRTLVSQLASILGIKRAGHIGTLDPMATGLVGVLLGRATLLASYLMGLSKRYRAEILLGTLTDTDDITGQLIEREPPDRSYPSRKDVVEALEGLIGESLQIPPCYSAISVNGIRSYKRARAGHSFSLPARKVFLFEATILAYCPPELSLDLKVSSGYYIRSLARDLPKALGLCGGTLSNLRRLEIGPFKVEDSVAFPFARQEILDKIIPPKAALSELAELVLDQEELSRFLNGAFLSQIEAKRIIAPIGSKGHLNSYPQGPIKILDGMGDLRALGKFAFSQSLPNKIIKNRNDHLPIESIKNRNEQKIIEANEIFSHNNNEMDTLLTSQRPYLRPLRII
ncbi:MAG: tRNA pseudouridine(55) synthase TruB [Deltaproteobacteria bacterium]|nr:tRNA pseudouridine(55) synthase TruB [Deltaproteobacteria bacterium]